MIHLFVAIYASLLVQAGKNTKSQSFQFGLCLREQTTIGFEQYLTTLPLFRKYVVQKKIERAFLIHIRYFGKILHL